MCVGTCVFHSLTLARTAEFVKFRQQFERLKVMGKSQLELFIFQLLNFSSLD